ncbi:MAG TPA: hypothetical protein D7H90_06345 [Candidatus Poseidoniales archaeon]|nr:MAG TPA: hypothetical protein D7H90_06345 [Candidatus Poseidoniales archaeon]HII57142.1 hypothetical protein [Candidatus Poseidoniaceae archaeon]
MSGLLSKANAAEEKEQPEPAEQEEKQNAGLLAASEQPSDGPDVSTILTSIGWAVIVVGGLLSLQGGSWGLIVVLTVLVIGIGALYAGQNMSERGVDYIRMSGAAVLAVLLAAGPYGVSMFMPDGGSFGISDLDLREDSDEISFRVIGSADAVDAVITADGVEKWSESKELSSESARFTVPISEIFVGNAWQCTSSSCPTTPVIEYLITVTSGDSTQTAEINPEFMTREVLDSGVKIMPVTVTETSNQQTTTEIDGIVVEMMAGLLPTSHEHLDGGGHTDANGIWVEGDYTLELVIKQGNTVVYGQSSSQGCPSATAGFPYIEVTGTTATSCDGDSVSVNGWFAMPGPATDQVGTEYLDLETFYGDDGCYMFQVTITNTLSSGEELVVVQNDVGWELDFDQNKEGPWDMNAC